MSSSEFTGRREAATLRIFNPVASRSLNQQRDLMLEEVRGYGAATERFLSVAQTLQPGVRKDSTAEFRRPALRL